MTKFIPDLKPRVLIFYFKIFKAWMTVFGPNQVWSRFGFRLNFKFKWARWSASLLSLSGARSLQLCCRRLLPPIGCRALPLQCPPPTIGLAGAKHSSGESRSGRIVAVSTHHLPRCYRCHVRALKHLSESREPPKMTPPPLFHPRPPKLIPPPTMKT
jgi:hypothetical protein